MSALLDPATTVAGVLLLLDLAAKGAILLALAGVAALLARNAPAASRHLIWCVGIVAVLLVPLLTIALPGRAWRILPADLFATSRTLTTRLPSVERYGPPQRPAPSPRSEGQPREATPSPSKAPLPPAPETPLTPEAIAALPASRVTLHWSAWVLLVWAAGAVLAALPLLAGTLRLRRLVRAARPVAGAEWEAARAGACAELGVRAEVALLESAKLRLPIVWGLVRHVILLPAEAAEWSEERRRLVLLHELAHVRRRDCPTQLLAQLAGVLHWFDPLAWVAVWRLRVERERACDDRVLLAGVKASAYAHHLLEIARGAGRGGAALAGVAMAYSSQMEGRLLGVLDLTLPRGTVSRRVAVAALLASLATAFPLALIDPAARAPASAGIRGPGVGLRKLPWPAFNSYGEQVSPDGTRMALIYTMPAQWDFQLGVYELATGRLTPLTRFTQDAARVQQHWPESPVWSPDGRAIAFTQTDWTTYVDLRVLLPGGRQRLLYRTSGHAKRTLRASSWLSDGSAIVAVLQDEKKERILGLVPLAGGVFRPLCVLGPNGGKRPQASPDGKFILFDTPDGEIGTISTQGGARRVLSPHPAEDRQPHWAPDGRHIVFRSLRGGKWALWGLPVRDGREAGAPFFIHGGMEKAGIVNWTPGNRLFYFDSYTTQDVLTLPVDPARGRATGQPAQIRYEQAGGNSIPAWSPDGRKLAFFSRTSDGRTRVVVLPWPGGTPVEYPVPIKREFGLERLEWLPEESALTFAVTDVRGRPRLHRLDLRSRRWSELSFPKGAPDWWTSLAWTRDGSTYLTTVARGSEMTNCIVERRLKDGRERVLWTCKPPLRRVAHLRLSPDGQSVAFVGVGDGPEERNWKRLWVLDLRARRAREVSRQRVRESTAAWSPDGRYLVAEVQTDPVGLAVFPAAGGAPHHLDIGGKPIWRGPSWSPDGRTIAFTRFVPGFDLWVMEDPLVQVDRRAPRIGR